MLTDMDRESMKLCTKGQNRAIVRFAKHGNINDIDDYEIEGRYFTVKLLRVDVDHLSHFLREDGKEITWDELDELKRIVHNPPPGRLDLPEYGIHEVIPRVIIRTEWRK